MSNRSTRLTALLAGHGLVIWHVVGKYSADAVKTASPLDDAGALVSAVVGVVFAYIGLTIPDQNSSRWSEKHFPEAVSALFMLSMIVGLIAYMSPLIWISFSNALSVITGIFT